MILAVDVGNSSTTVGLVERNDVRGVEIIPGGSESAPLGRSLGHMVDRHAPRLEGVCLCSVVPGVTDHAASVCRRAGPVVVIDHSVDTGLRLCYENPEQLGPDRLVNAFAAWKLHGPTAMVVDLGTAITVDIVGPDAAYLGGAIAVGVGTAAEALHTMTARLPLVVPKEPPRAVGTSTVESLRSGVFWGAVAMVEGLVERIKAEARFSGAVIATGGWSEIVGPRCRVVDTIDRWLTLKGLGLLWERLHGGQG